MDADWYLAWDWPGDWPCIQEDTDDGMGDPADISRLIALLQECETL